MKVLIVFGSERGGTAGVAQLAGASFRDAGWTAEVRDASVPGPVDADAVVVGGALYANRWHRAARHFVRRHEAALLDRPVWLFSSGPLDDSARAGDIAAVPQVQAIARRLEARGHMTFGGRLEPGAKGILARQMARKMSGDWREPDHVAEWVRQILHDLDATTVQLTAAERSRAVTLPRQRAAADARVTT